MKLGWLSDVHLNFTDDVGRRRFFADLATHQADVWLVSGDTGEATSILGYLREFEGGVDAPTYFVLGNHDFYRGSMRQVAADVASLASSSSQLTWLTQSGPKLLEEGLAVVGDDGWADARLGDPLGTPVELNDFYLIEELTGHSREVLVSRLNRLGDKAAARLRSKLDRAATRCGYVVVVTHVPPFEGATWHKGEISSADWLPWFSCDAVGRAVVKCADRHPETSFLVLCGHTHSPGQCFPRPNVVVHTAAAEYGCPRVQAVIELEGKAGSHAA